MTIAAGISLQGIPITVDVGGAVQSFVLNKSGQANDGGGNKSSLNADHKNGVTKQGDYKFTFKMSNLGFVEAARGNDPGAQAWYERAITADPTYPHVYRRLADLYYDRKDWSHALAYYRRVLTAIPKYFDVLVQAGNSARFSSDQETAAAYYAEAGRVRPDSWIPPYNLACLRAVNGEPEVALALLGEAVDLGFGVSALLNENEDFAAVRPLDGWAALAARVVIAENSIQQAGE